MSRRRRRRHRRNPDAAKIELAVRVTGAGAGVYAGSEFGSVGAVGGGIVGYALPIVGYGAALWRLGHPLLGALVAVGPILAGEVRKRGSGPLALT